MESSKGITLVSLVIYIVVMIITIGVISSIMSQFEKNNNQAEKSGKEILELNSFNTYFLKEIKAPNNAVDSVQDQYILFKSGNSFSLDAQGIINYNNKQICKNVSKLKFVLDENDNSIINVTIEFKDENFSKTMKYKVEEIY